MEGGSEGAERRNRSEHRCFGAQWICEHFNAEGCGCAVRSSEEGARARGAERWRATHGAIILAPPMSDLADRLYIKRRRSLWSFVLILGFGSPPQWSHLCLAKFSKTKGTKTQMLCKSPHTSAAEVHDFVQLKLTLHPDGPYVRGHCNRYPQTSCTLRSDFILCWGPISIQDRGGW